MKKVHVVNTITGQMFGMSHIEDPTIEIARCVDNNYWGLGERKLIKKGQENAVDYPDELVVSEVIEETTAAYEVPLYEKDINGDTILEDYTYIDPISGQEVTGQRQIPTGETEIIPAVMTTFVNLRPEYDIVITDITVEYELNKRLDETIATGKIIRNLCQDVLNLITGSNIGMGKSSSEIDQMEIDLGAIATKLERSRFDTAKSMIIALDNPTYSSLKLDVLKIYERYGF